MAADGPNCKKYGDPLYGAAWVPPAAIRSVLSSSEDHDDSAAAPPEENHVVLAGGGGEGSSGIPNALLIANFNFESNSLSDQPDETKTRKVAPCSAPAAMLFHCLTKKHKVGKDGGKKSKGDRKNKVSNNGIYQTKHGGEDEVIEGGKSAKKEDGKRGDIVKKKEDSGEKSKEDKKNEFNNNGIYETRQGGEDEIINVGKSAEKEHAERGDIEKKKKKKRKVGEDNSDGYREVEKGNEDGKPFELAGARNHDRNVVEKVERKNRKREKDKNMSSSNHLQEQNIEDAKDGKQLSVYGNEMQNGKRFETIGRATDGDVVASVEKKRKKKKKKKKKEVIEVCSGDLQQGNSYLATNETKENKNRGKGVKLEACGEGSEVDCMEKRVKKKRKRENKNESIVSGATGQGSITEEHGKGKVSSTVKEKLDRNMKNGNKGKREKAKLVDNGSEDAKLKKSKKKVRFSGDVEVFPPSEDNLVRGKRFSKEEDEIVKEAVFNYIEAHSLGEEGLKMVLNCKSYPKIKNCWKEISTCLPNRPHTAIYYRAQVLFRRDAKRKWTEEEIEFLQKSQETPGLVNQWKVLAEELGKHRFHVKDTWRRIKLGKTLKKGNWSQKEYQDLFDLVNTDLRMKYYEEKISKHGMLRDNIPWTAISEKLTTRSDANCCLKWYGQLTSPMVEEGKWADADDYRLIDSLFQLDASCTEDVDWDNLLDGRPGDVCRKRWNQMVLHMGNNGNKSFPDLVEVLTKRYCPDLFEAREAWDSKPVVP